MMLSTSLIVGRIGWRLPWIISGIACAVNCMLMFLFGDYKPAVSSKDLARV